MRILPPNHRENDPLGYPFTDEYIEWYRSKGYGTLGYKPRNSPAKLTHEDIVEFVKEKLSCCNTPLDEYRRCSECGEGC